MWRDIRREMQSHSSFIMGLTPRLVRLSQSMWVCKPPLNFATSSNKNVYSFRGNPVLLSQQMREGLEQMDCSKALERQLISKLVV